MLITNFASGELSNNLFGRVDLPQYYSGAAHLENFDVIPTGGIKRRTGMKRLMELETEGRLIPFIINRKESYLLLLTHEKITIYRAGQWDEPLRVFTNADINQMHEPVEIEQEPEGESEELEIEEVEEEKPSETEEETESEESDNEEKIEINKTDENKYLTLYSENEIHDIQYAQHMRIMIIAHPAHPPLEIKFNETDIAINIININIDVKQEHAPEIISTFEQEEDKYYLEKGYLKREGQYPKCVAFLNGRLVFAATKQNTQRLFFSAVSNYNDFSTYKSFITEMKNYVIVRGRLTEGSKKIELIDHDEAEKIIAPELKEYYFESRFFDDGTKLIGYPLVEEDNKIWMYASNPAKNISAQGLPEGVLEDLEQRVEAFHNFQRAFNRIADVNLSGPGFGGYNKINIILGANTFTLTTSSGFNVTHPVFYNIAEIIDNGTAHQYLVNTIRSAVQNFAASYPGYTSYTESYANYSIEVVAAVWIPYLLEHNKYEHPDLPNPIYYNTMPEIYEEISNIRVFSEVYIPLYTKEQNKEDMPTPDCGFMFEIATGTSDAILWLSVNKGIVVGTELAEIVIPQDVNPTNTYAIANSRYGCDNIPGEAVGDATIFFQTGRRSLVEYYIPEADNHFRVNNLAMLAEQMLRESPSKDFDYTATPYTRLIITREDGQVVTLLYDRSTGTFSWSRITTGEVVKDLMTPQDIEKTLKEHNNKKLTYEFSPGTFKVPSKTQRAFDGKVKSVAVLPGISGYDEIFLVVERYGQHYLELLSEDSPEGGEVYLDSWRDYNDDKTGYTKDAIVYEGKIGYPYTSIITSMPIHANQRLKQTNIHNLNIRFLDSYMPVIKSLPAGRVNKIDKPEPNSDVIQSYFDGGWDKNLQFEIYHDKPTRCKILAVYAEAE